MTQEEKELLLKDLCGRLLYQPNLQIYYEDIAGSGVFDEELYEIDIDGQYCNDGRRLEDIKPYLRPLSSMTEEEIEQMWDIYENDSFAEGSARITDFFLKRHLDCHHLIEKGLALEASKDMYKF